MMSYNSRPSDLLRFWGGDASGAASLLSPFVIHAGRLESPRRWLVSTPDPPLSRLTSSRPLFAPLFSISFFSSISSGDSSLKSPKGTDPVRLGFARPGKLALSALFGLDAPERTASPLPLDDIFFSSFAVCRLIRGDSRSTHSTNCLHMLSGMSCAPFSPRRVLTDCACWMGFTDSCLSFASMSFLTCFSTRLMMNSDKVLSCTPPMCGAIASVTLDVSAMSSMRSTAVSGLDFFFSFPIPDLCLCGK
mmetsp:Transcript_17991/g.51088  ORF Transcript_17991/g.51088 Transcript_17991/m.51088 type:complete len:248 (+) Transcript_17991:3086-3829(+)